MEQLNAVLIYKRILTLENVGTSQNCCLILIAWYLGSISPTFWHQRGAAFVQIILDAFNIHSKLEKYAKICCSIQQLQTNIVK
jgi:hypothetical protein